MSKIPSKEQPYIRTFEDVISKTGWTAVLTDKGHFTLRFKAETEREVLEEMATMLEMMAQACRKHIVGKL